MFFNLGGNIYSPNGLSHREDEYNFPKSIDSISRKKNIHYCLFVATAPGEYVPVPPEVPMVEVVDRHVVEAGVESVPGPLGAGVSFRGKCKLHCICLSPAPGEC